MLSWVLAAAPEPQPPTRDDSRVEIEESNGTTSVLVYEGDDVTAEIVLWLDGDDHVRLDANFEDGEYLRAVLDGDELVEHEASPAAADRVTQMLEATSARGVSCALHVLHMVAECVGPKVFCPLAMVWSACTCSETFASKYPDLCGE
jgi:hypothetical protein